MDGLNAPNGTLADQPPDRLRPTTEAVILPNHYASTEAICNGCHFMGLC